MENQAKVEFSNTLDEAQKKFRSNPLVYAIILLGVVGLLFPFLGWLMQSQEVHDLDQLKVDLENIQSAYKKVYGTVEKIISEESYRWQLSDHDRKLLKKLSQEKRNAFVEFFSFLYFLMQGCFFLLLGILLERKVFFPKRMMPKEKQEKVSIVLESKQPEIKQPEIKQPEIPIPPVSIENPEKLSVPILTTEKATEKE